MQHAREAYEAPLPKYVVDEFQKYLTCGDFAEGFVHVQCTTCGDDLAVAFSCKVRGLCPSCAGRRMAGAAAHLVDRVLPTTPIRQYVLAFPYELSGLAATRPEVLAALSRIFWESLLRRYREWAKSASDWRTLLERTFDTDLRVCVRCGGRLVIRAVVTDSASVAKLLAALRRPRAPPAAA